MKNLTQLLAMAILVSMSSCEEDKTKDTGKEMGNLYVSISKPQPGDEISIRYSKNDSVMPDAMVNYLVGTEFYPEDIALKDSAEAWYGKIKIPDTVQAIAFNFKKKDIYESNDRKGYVMPLYAETGGELIGSSAARGYYLVHHADKYNVKVEIDSALAMLERDFEKNSDLESDYESGYSEALLKADRKKGLSYIDKQIENYSGKDTLTTTDINSIYRLYEIKGATKKSDSVKSIALENYPKSDVAQMDLLMKVVQSKDLDEKINGYEKFKKLGIKNENYRNVMLRYIATAYSEDKDWENFEKYAAQIEDPSSKAGVYNSVAWDLVQKKENLYFAEEISKKSLDLLDKESVMEHKPKWYSKKQFQNSLEFSRTMFADTYALIKYKQGNLEKAIEFQEKAVSEKSGSDTNTTYVKFLTEDEQYEKAIQVAEEFITDNRGSAEMEDYFQTAYKKVNPEENFENHMSSLKEEALANQREELKERMLNEEAPSFKLQDLQGNEIALAELRGKTVILDFWATWCGPCKQSFPGMQKAVEKYQANENVEFYFVNTWENGDNRKSDVSEFIEENNYTFHVLMDDPVAEGSREFSVVSDYGINGIPTKIIIGPEGKINFKSVGYDGNNEKLLQEIGLMIELSQENEKPKA